jgi:CRISPR-associated protein Cas1
MSQAPIIPLKPIPIKGRISMIFVYYGRIDVLRGSTFVERGQ